MPILCSIGSRLDINSLKQNHILNKFSSIFGLFSLSVLGFQSSSRLYHHVKIFHTRKQDASWFFFFPHWISSPQKKSQFAFKFDGQMRTLPLCKFSLYAFLKLQPKASLSQEFIFFRPSSFFPYGFSKPQPKAKYTHKVSPTDILSSAKVVADVA